MPRLLRCRRRHHHHLLRLLFLLLLLGTVVETVGKRLNLRPLPKYPAATSMMVPIAIIGYLLSANGFDQRKGSRVFEVAVIT